MPGVYSNLHTLWSALACNEPSKRFRSSPSLPFSQSCFLGAEEGRGPDTSVAFCLFNNSSLNKPAIRGNLPMRLRLMENIQLALYLKLPEIRTIFQIADDLSSARASSPPASTPFLLPRQPAWKLLTQVRTTAAAARSSKQYTTVQKAVPLHKFIFYIPSGEQKRKKKGKGEDCS